MKQQQQNKTKPGKWFYLYCDVYDVRIVMYIGDPKEYAKNGGEKFLKKYFDKDYRKIINDINDSIRESNDSLGWCSSIVHNKKQSIIIFLQKLNFSDIEDFGTFIHECLHAALDIAIPKEVVERNQESHNEGFVYLYEWITKEFLKLIRKDTKNESIHTNRTHKGRNNRQATKRC